MGVRTLFGTPKVERNDRERFQHGLDEGFAAHAMLRRGPMHTLEQFGGRDRRDGDLLVSAQFAGQPPADHRQGLGRRLALAGPFQFDEDG